MTARQRLTVATPQGGWPQPWPRVAEISRVVGPEHWTLVGGLMVQLHAVAAGITSVRPTVDVDIVVHVETGRGRVADVVETLESLGYELAPSIDERARTCSSADCAESVALRQSVAAARIESWISA